MLPPKKDNFDKYLILFLKHNNFKNIIVPTENYLSFYIKYSREINSSKHRKNNK